MEDIKLLQKTWPDLEWTKLDGNAGFSGESTQAGIEIYAFRPGWLHSGYVIEVKTGAKGHVSNGFQESFALPEAIKDIREKLKPIAALIPASEETQND